MSVKIKDIKTWRIIHFSLITCIALLLNACSMNALQPKGSSVTIEPGIDLTLPQPYELGYSVTASQLISATWEDKTHQLPVQLQVDADKVILAGFSSWGTRILSLTYQDNQIDTDILTGLDQTLPQPEQILFNLMITLWPIDAWQQPLQAIGWYMVETNETRKIFDESDHAIIEITYQYPADAKPSDTQSDKLAKKVTFKHLTQGYKIKIQTLNSTIVNPPIKNE
mgnify:CR=1 FL=1